MTKKKEKSSKNVLRVFLEISFFLILSEISISIFHSLLILLSPRMCLWSSRWYRCKRWKNHTGNEINQSVRCGVWGTMWIEGKMAEIESCTSQHANERKKSFTLSLNISWERYKNERVREWEEMEVDEGMSNPTFRL